MAAVKTDANVNSTKYDYDSTNAYVSEIDYPDGTSEEFAHDFNTGLMTSHTDPNSQTTYYVYDSMRRPLSVSYPDGGETMYCYTDTGTEAGGGTCTQTSPPYQFVFWKKITSSSNFTETGTVDGLARLVRTDTVVPSSPCSSGHVYVDMIYDYDTTNHVRTQTVSNPDCSTSHTYNVVTWYDSLDRIARVTQQDGGTITTDYSYFPYVTVTDEAGKQRKSYTDALGRMTGVWEDPNNLNYETDYTYNTLDDLIQVVQSSSRTRTFTYDSLSRLLCSANPEIQIVTCPIGETDSGSYTAGTIRYTYDDNGNVSTKQAPRANQTSTSNTTTTTYSYDALNRLTGKSYSNSDPSVSYAYGGTACLGASSCYNVGRRTSMTDAGGSEGWSYDKMGRPLEDQRTTNSISKTFTYAYNYDGTTLSIGYPNSTIAYGVNVAEQPISAVDSTHSINYVPTSGGAIYAPHGALASLPNGSSLVSTLFYNSRLQPCRISAKYSGPVPGSCTVSSDAGNVLDLNYDFHYGSGDNGNVFQVTNNITSGRSINYTYDTLNRISTAETTSTYSTSPANCWSEAYVYDQVGGPSPWGNLVQINAGPSQYNSCSQESGLNITVNSNNQISTSGFAYDSAGNLTGSGSLSLTYDGESRICSLGGSSCTTGTTYTYDGDGKRVQKSSGTLYWYGTNPDPLLETDSGGNLTNEYVFFGGKRIARRDSSSNVFYYFADHLGSSRDIVQDGSTPTLCYDADFYPFGGERAYTTSCSQNYKFTAKERDSESNLDNFGARYFSSQYGRFMSPDPSSVGGDLVESENPQSWNMYSYVINNPLTAVDPDGLDCVFTQGDEAYVARGDCNNLPKGAQNATYVAGTVDEKSGQYDANTGTVSFSYKPYSADAGGSGAAIGRGFIVGVSPSSGNDLNPFAQGVFSQLNQMPMQNFIGAVYGGSVLVGVTGGAACYYFCPEAGVTALGLEGAGDAASTTPGQAASISRTAAQGGRKAVERALRSYQKRLADHVAKLGEIKGDPGSVQREVNNFRGLIKAAQDWLSKNP
jgi:RHS repeat-associated protein